MDKLVKHLWLLLIAVLVFAQTSIDIGGAAIDRVSYWSPNYTTVSVDNPANDTGTITSVEIWAYSNLSNCKVGTFSRDGAKFTPRDFETIGSVTAGSKQTFSGLSIDCESGDYIGIYYSVGAIEYTPYGAAVLYYKAGDQFGAGEQTYTLFASTIQSLYGTGTTGGGAPAASQSQVIMIN